MILISKMGKCMKEYRYLVITESGDIYKASTVTDKMYHNYYDGCIEIIDTKGPSEYVRGEWVDLREFEE